MDFERRKKLDELLIHLRYDIQHIEWIKRLTNEFSNHANDCADVILEHHKEFASH